MPINYYLVLQYGTDKTTHKIYVKYGRLSLFSSYRTAFWKTIYDIQCNKNKNKGGHLIVMYMFYLSVLGGSFLSSKTINDGTLLLCVYKLVLLPEWAFKKLSRTWSSTISILRSRNTEYGLVFRGPASFLSRDWSSVAINSARCAMAWRLQLDFRVRLNHLQWWRCWRSGWLSGSDVCSL